MLSALLPTHRRSRSWLAPEGCCHGPVDFLWGVFSACTVPAGCSVCRSCQEPVLGKCWSCSSFPRAYIFSCFLVTSSSLPTPGIPSGYRSPALDGCEPPPGTELRDGISFPFPAPTALLPPPASASPAQWPCSPFSRAISEPGWDQPFPLPGPEATRGGRGGAGCLVALLARSRGDVSPALADPGSP